MIVVNGNWEQIKETEDGIKLIEENMGKEFTQKFVSVLLHEIDGYESHTKREKVINNLYKYIGTV